MGKTLDGVPWWSQLRDPVPSTGRPDTAAATDCGEECVSMALWALRRKYTDAGDLRAELGKPPDDGRTAPPDLVRLLLLHGVQGVRDAIQKNGVKGLVHEAVDQGGGVLLLGNFLSPVELHWIYAIGYGNGACLYMDPWFGVLSCKPWPVLTSLCTGDAVRLVR